MLVKYHCFSKNIYISIYILTKDCIFMTHMATLLSVTLLKTLTAKTFSMLNI
uniref:Uncharacterized protein n=1 Tax=Anguilla anguilla TaxID=7936 RepID=A0A0E9VIA3_ANGAN